MEAETRAWIEAVLGEKLGECSLQEELKDGVVLCHLVNKLKPGSAVKPSTSKMPFKQMENVASYLNACKTLGVQPFEMFMTVDLYEGKNMQAVLINLQSLGRIAQSLPGYTGPIFGAKMATATPREFSEEQLNQAKGSGTWINQGSRTSRTSAVIPRAPAIDAPDLSPSNPLVANEAAQPASVDLPSGEEATSTASPNKRPSRGMSAAIPPTVESQAPGSRHDSFSASQPSVPPPTADVPAELIASVNTMQIEPSTSDTDLESQTRAWIEAVLGEKLGECSLQEELKDGVVLCNLMNKLKPGSCVKPSTSKMPFKQMENVAAYLSACKDIGVQPFEMFMTVDLFENKNMQAVLVNLQSVGRIAQGLPGYSGPIFGAKVATANHRHFTEDQLRAGRNSMSLTGKGSHGGATQSGMSVVGNKNISKATAAGLEGLGASTPTFIGTGSHGRASQAGSLQRANVTYGS